MRRPGDDFPSPANLAAAFEDALSKLGLVDRKDPVTMTVAKLIIEVRKGGRDPKTREGHERPLIGMLLHGLLNILFHELLDSLRCLKSTGVGLIMGHR